MYLENSRGALSSGFGGKGSSRGVRFGALPTRKILPLSDLLFLFGVFGSLYAVFLTGKIIF